jgi:uncharacterized repeat protein (TIGR02543 family)
MSKKKLAGIIAGSVVGAIIIIAIIAAVVSPEQTYTLSVSASPSGAGSVAPAGGEYEPGVQVTLTASPSSGYTFDYWSGSASGTTPTTTVTMNSDKSLTAHFKSTAQIYTLTISINPSAAGSVSPSGGEYESGDQITLTASPASGYTFDHWSGGASGTTPTTTITMDSDKSLVANFKTISTVSVDYEVIILYGSAYLSVRVEGPQKSYDIILFDPEGESVGYGFISSDDMITGHETKEVSMTGSGVTNPIPGEYWLIVEEFLTDKKVFEAKPVFEGPDVSITNVQFETDYYEYLEEGYIDEVTVQVYNGGDLPVFPDEIKYMVAGEQEDSTIYESLPSGETTVIDDWVYISGLGKGTHPVTVEIYSGGVKLDSYETQVEIG